MRASQNLSISVLNLYTWCRIFFFKYIIIQKCQIYQSTLTSVVKFWILALKVKSIKKANA